MARRTQNVIPNIARPFSQDKLSNYEDAQTEMMLMDDDDKVK